MLGLDSSAQKVQTILQKENLKGKVKTVYMTNGRDYIKIYFDESGKITREESKHSTNSIYVKYNYTYDSVGRIMSYVSYSMDRPDETLEYLYKYNDKGFLENIQRTYGYINYEYDLKRRCVVESNSALYPTKVKRIYNKNNQVIEDFYFNAMSGTLNVHKIGENGCSYEETQIVPPHEGSHAFYEYNTYGDVSRITIKGDTVHIDNITYDYDDRGNWIKRKHSIGYIPHWSFMEERGVSGSNFTRTIEYYE